MKICNCLCFHNIFDEHGVGDVVVVVSFAAVVLVLPALLVQRCFFCVCVCLCLFLVFVFVLFVFVYLVYVVHVCFLRFSAFFFGVCFFVSLLVGLLVCLCVCVRLFDFFCFVLFVLFCVGSV